MNRRQFALATLALIPSLYSASAQTKPPTRTPRATPQPEPTDTPIAIEAMEESDYRTRIVTDIKTMIDAMTEVEKKAIEALKAPARVTSAWVNAYVKQALTVTNTGTGLFAIDPPASVALGHVYVLRYANAMRESVEKYNKGIEETDTDAILAAQRSATFASGEFNKAISLLKRR